MKKILATFVLLAALSMVGCAAKMTGPFNLQNPPPDVSKMTMIEQECMLTVLGFGPYKTAVLTKKVDAIQYSFENYVVYSLICAEGYKK